MVGPRPGPSNASTASMALWTHCICDGVFRDSAAGVYCGSVPSRRLGSMIAVVLNLFY